VFVLCVLYSCATGLHQPARVPCRRTHATTPPSNRIHECDSAWSACGGRNAHAFNTGTRQPRPRFIQTAHAHPTCNRKVCAFKFIFSQTSRNKQPQRRDEEWCGVACTVRSNAQLSAFGYLEKQDGPQQFYLWPRQDSKTNRGESCQSWSCTSMTRTSRDTQREVTHLNLSLSA
jgi:hypothetical protein